MAYKFEDVVVAIEGTQVAARVRVRERRQTAKARDVSRRAQREFARDREYA